METLQRIYGISFPDNKMMKEWEKFQEEARNRDHRKIGKVCSYSLLLFYATAVKFILFLFFFFSSLSSFQGNLNGNLFCAFLIVYFTFQNFIYTNLAHQLLTNTEHWELIWEVVPGPGEVCLNIFDVGYFEILHKTLHFSQKGEIIENFMNDILVIFFIGASEEVIRTSTRLK